MAKSTNQIAIDVAHRSMSGGLVTTWRRLSIEQKLLLLLLATTPSLIALVLIRLGLSPSTAAAACMTHLTDTQPRPTQVKSPLTVFDELEAEVNELKLQLTHLSDARLRDVALCESRAANASARLHELQSLMLIQRDKWRQETQETIAQLERERAHTAVPGAVVDATWTDLNSAHWSGVIRRKSTQDVSLGSQLDSAKTLRKLLRDRWLFFYGDSTMRVLFNALLDAIDAPPDARLLYGDACVEFMNATDSRHMCQCRLEHAHKDWTDPSTGLRISLAWKESMFDGAFDRRRFEDEEWIRGSKRRRPDVLVLNSGFHAYHMQSNDESIVFRGRNLTANVPFLVASEAEQLFALLSLYMSRGGCAIWRATNTVSRSDGRLAPQPFAALSHFVTPMLLRRGVHVFNATASLSASPPVTHASTDGLHYEAIAPIWATMLARSIDTLCTK